MIKMYSEKKFQANHMATLGLDFVSKTYKPPGSDKEMQVKIWDTAGQERFRTLTLSFYKQANGVIVAFDVTNEESFRNVRGWLESIYEHADQNVAKILVGNKVDLKDERKTSQEDAREIAKQHNMNYYDASAKENININELMEDLMGQVYMKRFAAPDPEPRPTFSLRDRTQDDTSTPEQKKKKCCK